MISSLSGNVYATPTRGNLFTSTALNVRSGQVGAHYGLQTSPFMSFETPNGYFLFTPQGADDYISFAHTTKAQIHLEHIGTATGYFGVLGTDFITGCESGSILLKTGCEFPSGIDTGTTQAEIRSDGTVYMGGNGTYITSAFNIFGFANGEAIWASTVADQVIAGITFDDDFHEAYHYANDALLFNAFTNLFTLSGDIQIGNTNTFGIQYADGHNALYISAKANLLGGINLESISNEAGLYGSGADEAIAVLAFTDADNVLFRYANGAIDVFNGIVQGPSASWTLDQDGNLTTGGTIIADQLQGDGSAIYNQFVMTPSAATTGGTVTFGGGGAHETIYLTSASTIVTLTAALPSVTRVGQMVRLNSKSAVTTLTVTGTVVSGTNPAALTAGGNVAYQATDTTGTFIRIQ